MKKSSIILAAASMGVFFAMSSISAYEYKSSFKIEAATSLKTRTSLTTAEISANSDIFSLNAASSSTPKDKPRVSDKEYLYSQLVAFGETPEIKSVTEDVKLVKAQPAIAVANTAKPNATMSRGGTPPVKSDTQRTVQAPASRGAAPAAGTSSASTSKVETLDWWKQAQYAFPVGSVATVRDVYTGRTFKVKRTMGSNHADCEALTQADTDVIKSIWGGFSWNVRPVHVIINGRVLAASMNAMPHAGLDSAPAYAVIDNRSGGYGRGQNLDVVKGNGMDGHFDIHFLNSSRHKDGKVDSRHQEAVRIAAGR
jgi:hypothetical protein